MTKPNNRKRWIWPAAAVAALGGAAALFGPNLALDHASLTTLPPETARPPADRDAANTATVDLAGHEVPVLEGGLFDRFRSNPPLSVVQGARPELDLSWFEGITKEKKEVDSPHIRRISITTTAASRRFIPLTWPASRV